MHNDTMSTSDDIKNVVRIAFVTRIFTRFYCLTSYRLSIVMIINQVCISNSISTYHLLCKNQGQLIINKILNR